MADREDKEGGVEKYRQFLNRALPSNEAVQDAAPTRIPRQQYAGHQKRRIVVPYLPTPALHSAR